MAAALTTLANVQTWLGLVTNADNALVDRLIAQASQMILSHLQRPSLFQQTYSDVYDGPGRERLILRNWPVLSVSSLTIGTTSVAAASSYGQCGYTLEPWNGMPPGNPQALNLFGHRFWGGNDNILVSYAAGYVVQKEAHAVPAVPSQITVNAPYGNWAADQGVTYANGTVLTAVAANPAQGQYAASSGVYTFNAADAAASVLISYSFVPSDIEQACIELVGERYRYMGRIGEKSKTLGGQETTSYSLAMPDYIVALLQPYKRTIMA